MTVTALQSTMRNPHGCLILSGEGGETHCDTFKCGHCQKIVPVPPKCAAEKLGGQCKVCMALVCPACYRLGRCDPFEKKLERIESRSRFLRQAGI